MWLTVSDLKVMELVSGLLLVNHHNPGFFGMAHASRSQDGFQQGG